MFGPLTRAARRLLVSFMFSRCGLALAPQLLERLRNDPQFRASAAKPEARMLFAAMSRVGESRAQLFQDL